MCKVPGLYKGDNEFQKANRKIDPLGAYVNTGDKDMLDPVNLKNEIVIPTTPMGQESKAPDTMVDKRRVRNTRNSTLLTGPTGLTTGALNTGGSTLLGG